jgi:hypothetical protein
MSWNQLLSIRDQNAQHLADEQQPPTTCPLSGDLLVTTSNGDLLCVFEGWRWRG